jgi:excisionase family DNA binding protein
MAFTLDRDTAARRLWVSTRTIDRHIQWGRIRTRRIGKKMFIEEDDIENLRLQDTSRREETYEVISDSGKSQKTMKNQLVTPTVIDSQAITEFTRLYDDAKRLIEKKDEVILDLSYRLGKTETELKNSISLTEYKKATFLLESAKMKNDEDKTDLSRKIDTLEKELHKRGSAMIAIAILFVLVLGFSLILLYARL